MNKKSLGHLLIRHDNMGNLRTQKIIQEHVGRDSNQSNPLGRATKIERTGAVGF